jgi:hypothetical protein
MNSNLPFPLGHTAADGVTIAGPVGLVSQLPTATGDFNEATPYHKDLAGLVVEYIDVPMANTTVNSNAAAKGTVAGYYCAAGTNLPGKLRCVQAGAAITTTCIGQIMGFDATAGQFGVVATATSVDGGVGKPIHGGYPVGTVFAKYDWFWVVEEGPAVVTPADSVTLAAHGPVSVSDATGHVGPAVATDAVVGTADVAVTGDIDTTTHAHLALIYVKAGIQAEEA